MENTIPKDEATDRIETLIHIQKEITSEILSGYVGQIQNVLFTEPSRRNEGQYAGKNEYNITVNVSADASVIGKIVPVRITAAKETTLLGELMGE